MKNYRTTRPRWMAAFWLGPLLAALPTAGNARAAGHRHSTATPTPDTAPDVITVKQSTINFGDQRVGRSTTEDLEMRNDSGEPLTLTLAETGSTDYSFITKCPTTIKPHGSARLRSSSIRVSQARLQERSRSIRATLMLTPTAK